MDKTLCIGIGASAGGLEPIKEVFEHIDPNDNLAYAVIQHLSPDFKSMMKEILEKRTSMNVVIIEDQLVVEPYTVYLIPPSSNVKLENGKFKLESQDRDNNFKINLPIDIFFKSLAKEYGERAVGIILSGTGSDGASGCEEIHQNGGKVIVQEPRTAQFDGMPVSIIKAGIANYIRVPNEIPDTIKMCVNNENENTFDAVYMRQIIESLKYSFGIDFNKYKEPSIERRIKSRADSLRLNTPKDYINLIKESNNERKILKEHILIGVTEFFRDIEVFNKLEDTVYPNIDFDKKEVRIWSAGCSTGEEAYSLAISLKEYMLKNNLSSSIKIFATDINELSIAIASKGYYETNKVVDLNVELLKKYFENSKDGYYVNDEIRRMVSFSKHDVLNDPPFTNIDMISCRNLLIYLNEQAQRIVFQRFSFSLKNGGYLLLGTSESIGKMTSTYEVIDSKNKIFRCSNFRQEEFEIKPSEDSYMNRIGPYSFLPQSKMDTNELMEKIISTSLPPSVLIDSQHNIIRTFNDISAFIDIKSGIFNMNYNTLMDKKTAMNISNIINRLRINKDESVSTMTTIRGKNIVLNAKTIDVKKQEFYLISFNDNLETGKSTFITKELSKKEMDQVIFLEKELDKAIQTNQLNLEYMESSKEELQTMNEELISSNEELQSTNEELQSVNEELYTVNQEYMDKVNELSKSKNDLDNLIVNSEVAALYLDNNLCIRKCTPIIFNVTNIKPVDIGRSLKEIIPIEEYTDLYQDVNNVLESLKSIHKVLKLKNGRIYTIRVSLYRTEKKIIDGIILTLNDVTEYEKNLKALTPLDDGRR